MSKQIKSFDRKFHTRKESVKNRVTDPSKFCRTRDDKTFLKHLPPTSIIEARNNFEPILLEKKSFEYILRKLSKIVTGIDDVCWQCNSSDMKSDLIEVAVGYQLKELCGALVKDGKIKFKEDEKTEDSVNKVRADILKRVFGIEGILPAIKQPSLEKVSKPLPKNEDLAQEIDLTGDLNLDHPKNPYVELASMKANPKKAKLIRENKVSHKVKSNLEVRVPPDPDPKDCENGYYNQPKAFHNELLKLFNKHKNTSSKTKKELKQNSEDKKISSRRVKSLSKKIQKEFTLGKLFEPRPKPALK